MKTEEDLNTLKEEVKKIKQKLTELSDEELKQVTGGWTDNGDGTYNIYSGEMFRDGYSNFGAPIKIPWRFLQLPWFYYINNIFCVRFIYDNLFEIRKPVLHFTYGSIQ